MKEIATFAMGCFWGVEVLFKKVKGVEATTVGYIGGNPSADGAAPSYEKVCTGASSYAEAIEIEFDPQIVTFQELLDLFWESHDPTTLNRQGPDTGSQYRSAIFYHSKEQKTLSIESRDRLERDRKYLNPIVTEIVPAPTFYPAEEYHQDYVDKNPNAVCAI